MSKWKLGGDLDLHVACGKEEKYLTFIICKNRSTFDSEAFLLFDASKAVYKFLHQDMKTCLTEPDFVNVVVVFATIQLH